ncbi:MAG: hypothetical protein JSW04_15610, partial [Desulfobacterales bacterium]
KIKFALVGTLLALGIAHLNMHGTGHEYIYHRYLMPCLFGGLTGFLIGLMRDRRVRLKSKSMKGSGKKFAHSQDTNTESTLYFGNNNTLTFHLPECHRSKKLRNRVIFKSRERAVNLGYIPYKLCIP